MLVLASEPIEPDARVLALALAAIVAGYAWLGVLALTTRPRRPRPGPSSSELGADPEPPAVVDLVTDDFEVTTEAVPATLLDLAARRWVDLEQYGDDTICRVRNRDGQGELTPYERRVLDHVRARAVDGVVPAAALSTGPQAASAAWWRGFDKEVVADARERGLCRRRWSPAAVATIWVLLGVAVLLYLVATDFREAEEVEATPLLTAVLLSGMALAALAVSVSASTRQRETPAGLAAASRWMGVRTYLAAHGSFHDTPAAAVAIWQRYLGYAAALDLATLAVRQLPLGAEDDRHAWSRATGRWRPVRVGYPRLRSGWGRHPLFALASGVAVAGTSAVAASRLLSFAWPPSEVVAFAPEVDVWIGRVAVGVAVALAAVVVWWGLRALAGLADLFATHEVEGVVLRKRSRGTPVPAHPGWVRWLEGDRKERPSNRRWFVAVDSGEHDRVAAWSVRPAWYDQVRQDQRVRVRVTPLLGYVRSIEVAGGDGGSAAAQPGPRERLKG